MLEQRGLSYFILTDLLPLNYFIDFSMAVVVMCQYKVCAWSRKAIRLILLYI
jgi:hypothetical protein